jgi:hypothetical protein
MACGLHPTAAKQFLLYSAAVTIARQSPTLTITMAKKSRGGRMTAAKNRAAKSSGGKGLIKNRPAGRNIMKT